jgi:hypothetical protein
MTLESNYTDLVDSCRDAGLVVTEQRELCGYVNIHSALVARPDSWTVGSIQSVPQCSGKAVLVMDLFQNKMDFFVKLFEALETRERSCL